MRISDWSSDVCSSDLHGEGSLRHLPRHAGGALQGIVVEQHRLAVSRQHDVEFDPARAGPGGRLHGAERSEEHTSELQSLMRISYAVFCLKKKKKTQDIIK